MTKKLLVFLGGRYACKNMGNKIFLQLKYICMIKVFQGSFTSSMLANGTLQERITYHTSKKVK